MVIRCMFAGAAVVVNVLLLLLFALLSKVWMADCLWGNFCVHFQEFKIFTYGIQTRGGVAFRFFAHTRTRSFACRCTHSLTYCFCIVSLLPLYCYSLCVFPFGDSFYCIVFACTQSRQQQNEEEKNSRKKGILSTYRSHEQLWDILQETHTHSHREREWKNVQCFKALTETAYIHQTHIYNKNSVLCCMVSLCSALLWLCFLSLFCILFHCRHVEFVCTNVFSFRIVCVHRFCCYLCAFIIALGYGCFWPFVYFRFVVIFHSFVQVLAFRSKIFGMFVWMKWIREMPQIKSLD